MEGKIKMKKLGKKGVLDNLSALGIGAVSVTITLAIVFLIFSNLASNTSIAADGNATAATSTIQAAVGTIPGWVPLIILVAIGVLLLFMIRGFNR